MISRLLPPAAARDAEERSKVRTIYRSTLERVGERLVYTVRGSGFLKHMVRNLVGTLIEIGRGSMSDREIPPRSGATAPARGLTLISVEYASEETPFPRATLNP